MPNSLELVRPVFSWAPPFAKTLGPEVADLASMAGFAPDPEQRLALDLLFGRTATGRVAAFEFLLVCPRQNLKTAFLQQASLGWLYITNEELTIWSAHEFSTAQEAFRDMCALIESSPDLDREVRHIHRGNGDEAIELSGNRRLKFKARTKGGGRGLTGNKVVLDEAMFLQGVHMGSLLPTLAAVEDPQVVMVGSAGLAGSDVMRAARNRGRAGDDPRLAYLEWCDPRPGECATDGCQHQLSANGCALDDRDRWRQANPAMGRRIGEDYIAAERRALPPEEFGRERLGWWDEPGLALLGIPAEAWEACRDIASAPVGRLTFAVELAEDRSGAAIAVAIRREDKRVHVEVIEHRRGTSWIVPRLAELVRRWRPGQLLLDPSSPAGSLSQDLATANIEPKLIGSRELGQACGAFYDGVIEDKVRHLGQADLDMAVAVGTRRQLGDAWVWNRRTGADTSPLLAVTLAHWGVTSRPRSRVINLNALVDPEGPT